MDTKHEEGRMKEGPILMQGDMVVATLEGRKTHTRRILKGLYPDWINNNDCMNNIEMIHVDGFFGASITYQTGVADTDNFFIKCPYGQPGNQLWVRETFCQQMGGFIYRATDNNKFSSCFKWKPSIFMPRNASRIQLEIKDIKVERVQDISIEDALEEGISPMTRCGIVGPIAQFKELWNFINAKPKPKKKKGILHHYESYPWDELSRDKRVEINGKPHHCYPNPFVWVVSFRRIKP